MVPGKRRFSEALCGENGREKERSLCVWVRLADWFGGVERQRLEGSAGMGLGAEVCF